MTNASAGSEQDLTRVDDALLRQMVTAIVDEADPEQVILFGSRARGDARVDSDVDLVVVEAEPFGPDRSRCAEAVRLRRALPGFDVSVDILVYSRDEVDYWHDSLNNVLARRRTGMSPPCAASPRFGSSISRTSPTRRCTSARSP